MEMMNKPPSMGVREWLIKTLSAEINIPQNTISKIVSHNYDEVHQALKLHKSVEIAGFGKMYFNQGKADRYVAFLLRRKDVVQELLDADPDNPKLLLEMKGLDDNFRSFKIRDDNEQSL
jgi:hypothetical protein